MWCLSVAAERPQFPGSSRPAVFGKRLLVWLVGFAVLCGIVIVRSGSVPHPTDITVVKPRAVLIAVRGSDTSTLGPGIAAFIAVIDPSVHSVGIIEVPGSMPAVGGTLSEIAPTATPQVIASTVSANMHINLSGYVVLDVSTAETVLTALQQEAPNWPQELTPSLSLYYLGWPYAHPQKGFYLPVLQDLVQDLPQIPNNQNFLTAAAVFQGSKSNLSPYELFVLVTYFGDEHLVAMPLRSLPASLKQKQVKP